MKAGLGALAFLFLFTFIYGFTSHADAVASDEIAVLHTSVVLVTKGSLQIDDLMKIQKITNIGERGIGDHLYSKYFPGNVLGAGLLYRLAAKSDDTPYVSGNPTYGFVELAPSETGARVALRLNALLGAMGLAFMFLLFRNHFQVETAIIVVLLIGLTTDWWQESRMFFSEIGAGAFLAAGYYFADQRRPYLCSLFLGISLLFRPTNLLALPIWGYAVWSSWRENRRDIFSGVFIVGSLGFLALYNYARFHSIFHFGYENNGFTTPVLEGLTGVLLSPGHSLLVYSPIAIAAITGGRSLIRRRKGLAWAGIATILLYILMAATWQSWMGGKVWGNRLLVPVIPLIGFLIAAAVDDLYTQPTPRLLAVIVFLGLLGFGIQILTILQDPVVALNAYVQSGYTTQTEAIWSFSKNWLALEIKSFTNWNICKSGAYSLRMLFSQCR